MINIEIKKSSHYYYDFRCFNKNCLSLPEYTVSFMKNKYRIKSGTLYAQIGNETYCNGCIDQLYNHIKIKLNRNLWSFK
jgi:hypothetical protein